LEYGSVSSRKPVIDNTIYEIMDSDSDEEATPSPLRQTKFISQIVEPTIPSETFKSEPTLPKTSKSDFFANIERFVADGKRKEKDAEKNLEEAEERVAKEAETKKKEKGKKKNDQSEEVEPLRPETRGSSIPIVHSSKQRRIS
jgi:hypothetical protein